MRELTLDQVRELLQILQECSKPECEARSQLIIYMIRKYFENEFSRNTDIDTPGEVNT